MVKFSPDDKRCAVGGQDGRITVYDVEPTFRKASVIKKSFSTITSIDFSYSKVPEKNGQYLMINNQA